MAVNLNLVGQQQIDPDREVPFLDKHLFKIAFAVSTFALMIFSPLSLFLGAASGFALHYSIAPELTLSGENEIITLSNTVFSIVGAVGAFVKISPAGTAGGFLFQMIPLLSSFAIGSTVYRAFKSF
jgi:hypothetical protein